MKCSPVAFAFLLGLFTTAAVAAQIGAPGDLPPTNPASSAAPPASPPADASTGTLIVHVEGEDRPLAGASIRSAEIQAMSDRTGAAVLTLPVGEQLVRISMIGFSPDSLKVVVHPGKTEVSVELKESVIQMGEVIVAATRSERRVAEEPTRVEVTAREDVEEQLASSPGNIAELLTEAGGVRAQPLSGGLGGAGIRIHGLGGRYTKILSDGLPLFGLTTEGLAPLQIPPIDLDRVEVIKGVASALYGPTALGGVVNLVSEQPGGPNALLLNQSSHDASDGVLWASKQWDPRWGATLLASGNRQEKRDIDKDSWADLPGYRRAVLRPRLFWTGAAGNSWFLTTGLTAEDRSGGAMGRALLPDGSTFRETLRTRRFDAGSVARLRLDPGTLLVLKGSVTDEHRTRHFGDPSERDRRTTTFGEASLNLTRSSQVLVAGAALEGDRYRAFDVAGMSYSYLTPGLFAEHLWFPLGWLSLSSSARLDFHSHYGSQLSPRFSALLHTKDGWTARLSAGAGASTPTPFTDETEAIGLAHLRPISGLEAEKASSASIDLGGLVGPVELNASVYQTVLRHPVALRPLPAPAAVTGSASTSTSTPSAEVELVNADGPTCQGGCEMFARWTRGLFSLTGSYAYMRGTEVDVEREAELQRKVRREIALNPRHAGGLTAIWEEEDDTRVGLELYANGRQSLADDPYRSTSRPYLFVDALLQQRLGRFVLFLHGENLNDVRQTRTDPLLRPSPGPGGLWTTEIWAPLEGRVINLGVRWMF